MTMLDVTTMSDDQLRDYCDPLINKGPIALTAIAEFKRRGLEKPLNPKIPPKSVLFADSKP